MSPRLKNATFKLILLLLVISLLEGVSCVALKAVSGGASPADREARKAALAGEAGAAQEQSPQPSERVLHPYLGYVYRPGSTPRNLTLSQPVPFPASACEVNKHGFFSDDTFLLQGKRADTVKVIITGGSVANNLYCGFRKDLARSLSSLPAYSGKKFSFVGLAFEGWRQPQQLQALAYYLAQQGQANLLISLDGFNEVANQTRGYPFFPEYWRALAGGIQGRQELGLVGRLEVYRGWRRDLARRMAGVSWPATLNLMWAVGDKLLDVKIKAANLQLARLVKTRDGATAHSFRLDGPLGWKVTPEEMPAAGISAWEQSTRIMSRLARQAGIQSYHFVQPSLHRVGSKPLTSAEKVLAKQGRERYQAASARGYDMLEAAVTQLKAEGVQAVDLAGVFKDVTETLYVDSCCHFNAAGNTLMIQAMVLAMGDDQSRAEKK